MSNGWLVRRCLEAMGILTETAITDTIEGTTPLTKLQWKGARAPEELGKILQAINCVFSVTGAGTFKVQRVGEGARRVIPIEQRGYEVASPGIDRRGRIVLFCSAPNPVICRKTLKGPHPDTFEFVVQDVKKVANNKDLADVWVPIESCSLYPATPIELIRNRGQGVALVTHPTMGGGVRRC